MGVVSTGTLSYANIHKKDESGATGFSVHGGGIVIGRIINELTLARKVGRRSRAASAEPLDRQEKAEYAFARYPKVWAGLATLKVPYLIPGSKLSIYKGAGHGMMYQDTAGFVGEVVKFAG